MKYILKFLIIFSLIVSCSTDKEPIISNVGFVIYHIPDVTLEELVDNGLVAPEVNINEEYMNTIQVNISESMLNDGISLNDVTIELLTSEGFLDIKIGDKELLPNEVVDLKDFYSPLGDDFNNDRRRRFEVTTVSSEPFLENIEFVFKIKNSNYIYDFYQTLKIN